MALVFFLTHYHICTHAVCACTHTLHAPPTHTCLFQGHSPFTPPGGYPSFSIVLKLNQQANYYPSFQKRHVFTSSLLLVSLKFSPQPALRILATCNIIPERKITLQNGMVMPQLDISWHFRTTEKIFLAL